MQVKNDLEIILITYNRARYLEKTLENLFEKKSPVKECLITVFDNNSSDETQNLCEKYSDKFKNINYIRNKINVGLNGNLVKALDSVTKKYYWLICDDDEFDFTHWSEVEEAMDKDVDAICTCRYLINNGKQAEPQAKQLVQLTLCPAGIVKSKWLGNDTLRNVYENSYTLFAHMCVYVAILNGNGEIYQCKNQITKWGQHDEVIDCSYTRGNNEEMLYNRCRSINWITGFVNVISILKDDNLRYKSIDFAINEPWTYGSWNKFYKTVARQYNSPKNWIHLLDLYLAIPKRRANRLLLMFIFNRIFSINKEFSSGVKVKIITILGLKLKIRRKIK